MEDKRHKRELRTQAYLDYLRCVSEQANLADSKDKALLAEIYARTADSKGRICLYGSTKVIRKFAEFERLGANMTTPERRNVYIDMVMEMRKNSGYSRRVNSKDIGLLLFGNK